MKHGLLHDVWEGIRSQPGRVGLSCLAVGVGMVALTLLMALLGGLQEKSRNLVREFGAGVAAVVAHGDSQGGLTRARAELLAANLPGIAVSGSRSLSVKIDGAEESTPVVATDERLASARAWKVRRGRFLDHEDVAAGLRHAVISRGLALRQNLDVGGTLTLERVPFTIVGILHADTSGLAAEAADRRLLADDMTLYIPHTAPAAWIASSAEEAARVDVVYLKAAGEADLDRAVARAGRLLKNPPDALAGFDVITPDSLVAGIRKLQLTLRLSLGSIAILCLLLGGTTLMSLMVANVRDRIPEIGLRRALGAGGLDVSLLFIAESCLITLASAMLAVAVSWALMHIVAPRFPAPLGTGWETFVYPVLASVAMGIIFSYWPARMAARIAPAEALRND